MKVPHFVIWISLAALAALPGAARARQSSQPAAHEGRAAALAAYERGAREHRLGHAEAAIAAYREACRLDPQFAEAYNNLGNVYADAGRIDDAVRCLREAVRLRPTFAEAYNNLGVACVEAGDDRRAVDAFARALELRPDYLDACLNLGDAHFNAGRFGEAARVFARAVAIAPSSARARRGAGRAAAALGRLDDAERSLERAIALEPSAGACNDLGAVRFALKRYKEAAALFEEATRLAPDEAQAHFNLGAARLAMHDEDGALEQYTLLKTLRPEWANELYAAITGDYLVRVK